MKLQKIGGFSSIVSAFLMVIFLVFILLVFPRLGLVELSDWFDPVKGLDAGRASPTTFFLFNLELILWSIALILIVLALRERMQASAPILMRIAVIGVSITCALWLAAALIVSVGMPSIVSAQDASAFRAMMVVYFGLSNTGDFALGWALLLIGWAALKTKGLPRMLSYFSVLNGVVMIFNFVGGPIIIMISMLLSFVFLLWLGIVLLRSKS